MEELKVSLQKQTACEFSSNFNLTDLWTKEPGHKVAFGQPTSVEKYLFPQEMLRYKKNVSLIIFLAGFVAGISITSLCGSVIFHLLENFKDEDEVYSEHEQQASRDMAASKNKAD